MRYRKAAQQLARCLDCRFRPFPERDHLSIVELSQLAYAARHVDRADKQHIHPVDRGNFRDCLHRLRRLDLANDQQVFTQAIEILLGRQPIVRRTHEAVGGATDALGRITACGYGRRRVLGRTDAGNHYPLRSDIECPLQRHRIVPRNPDDRRGIGRRYSLHQLDGAGQFA